MSIKRVVALSVGFSGVGVTAAQAHVGAGATSLMAGIVHPFTGLDHMSLLMVAGLVAVYAGRTGAVRMALVVMAAWISGLAFASSGFVIPFVEQGIAGGLVLLGAVLALGGSALGRHTAVTAFIGISALFHGQAHGLEVTGSVMTFGLGSLVGAVLVMAAGGMFARLAMVNERLVGGAMAALGVVMLAS